MKHNRTHLLKDLKIRIQNVQETAMGYTTLEETVLNRKPAAESWSVLECLEHLNLYGDYYLPEMERSILQGKKATDHWFKAGLIGDYFARSMQPKADGNVKKMQAPKDKRPESSNLNRVTLDRFLRQLERVQKLLDMAAETDLKRSKTSISISKLIKLRLGDTFRFYVYHIERHIAQAERAIKKA